MSIPEKKIAEIKFTNAQKTILINTIGIMADGFQINKYSHIKLINPRSVSSVRFNDEQLKKVKGRLKGNPLGLAVDPKTFSVNVLDKGHVAMWGEPQPD